MISEHAPLPPSSANQWGNCGAWYRATRGMPNPETSETRFGTAAHWVFSESWTQGKPAVEFLGAVAPNGYVIDELAVEGADAMLDDITIVIQKFGGRDGLQFFCEFKLHMPDIHSECWGTTDFAIWAPKWSMIVVSDFKAGHRQHKAQGHKQTILYVNGVANQLGITGAQDEKVIVHIRIVQPFSYRNEGIVSTWHGRLSDLRGEFNQLNGKAHENMSANPRMSSGRWCSDCVAVGKCSAAKLAAYNAIDVTREPFALDDMQSADLAREYQLLDDSLKLVEARRDALKAELEYTVKNGDMSAGMVLENGPLGNAKWKVPPAQVIALAEQFGVDAKVIHVLTPRQVLKKIPKDQRLAFESILSCFTDRAPGSLKLIPARECFTGRAFSKSKE